jgi:hypothetical protein
MVHGTFEVDLTTEIGLFSRLSDPLASWLADVAAFAGKSICWPPPRSTSGHNNSNNNNMIWSAPGSHQACSMQLGATSRAAKGPPQMRSSAAPALTGGMWRAMAGARLLLPVLLCALCPVGGGEGWCGAPAADASPLPQPCTDVAERIASPARSHADGDGLSGRAAVAAGQVARLNITACDQFGQPFGRPVHVVCAGFAAAPPSALDDPFARAVTSASWATPGYTVRDVGAGGFTLEWTPSVAGRYHVALRLVDVASDGLVADCNRTLLEEAAAAAAVVAAGGGGRAANMLGSIASLAPHTLVGGLPFHVIHVSSGPTSIGNITVFGGSLFESRTAVAGRVATFNLRTADRYGNQQTSSVDESDRFFLGVFQETPPVLTGHLLRPSGRTELLNDTNYPWSVSPTAEAGLYLGSFTTQLVDDIVDETLATGTRDGRWCSGNADPTKDFVCTRQGAPALAWPQSYVAKHGLVMIISDGSSTNGVPNQLPWERTAACCERRITELAVELEVLFAADPQNVSLPAKNESSPISGSPFARTVQKMPNELHTQISAELSVGQSAVAGPAVATAGSNVSLSVSLINEWGDAMPWKLAYGAMTCIATFQPTGHANGTQPGSTEALFLKANGPGVYSSVLRPTLAGVYSVSVTMARSGALSPGQPYIVMVDAAATERTEVIFEVFDPGATVPRCRNVLGLVGSPCGIVAGDSAELKLASRDRYGNPRSYRPSYGHDQYEVLLQHTRNSEIVGKPIRAEVVGAGNETYKAVARLTLSGYYDVRVSLYTHTEVRDVAKSGDMTIAVDAASPVPGQCWAGGPGSTQAVVGQAAEVHVKLLDQYGNYAVPGPSWTPSLRIRTFGTGPSLASMMTSPGERPAGVASRCSASSCDDTLCFCHFPFAYGGETWNTCKPAGSKFICATKRRSTDPSVGTRLDGGAQDYRCGVKNSLSSGFTTRSMDYCLPPDEAGSRWDPAQRLYQVFYMPTSDGNLTLHIEIETSPGGSFQQCATTASDVRYGGRLLITEINYNPPDVPIQNGEVTEWSQYKWKSDGTALEFIELHNAGNAPVSLHGLAFTEGVHISFGNQMLGAGAYAIVARDPSHSTWSDVGCEILGRCHSCAPFWVSGSPGTCSNLLTQADCAAKSGIWAGYSGSLSNDGERLTLAVVSVPGGSLLNGTVVVDTVFFDDDGNWTRKPDGFVLSSPPNPRAKHLLSVPRYTPGTTLERTSLSMDQPSDDSSLWRASIVAGGTPCLPYVLLGEPVNVRITAWATTPEHPKSSDEVMVSISLTGPKLNSTIKYVTMLWENTICQLNSTFLVPMSEVPERRVLNAGYFDSRQGLLRTDDTLVYKASLPSFPAEALIRMTIEVAMKDCSSIRLPHVGEIEPFLSFWVYGSDLAPTVLPRIYIYPDTIGSQLHFPAPSIVADGHSLAAEFSTMPIMNAYAVRRSAVVIIMPGTDEKPQVFEGVHVAESEMGHSIKFESVKFEELRTLDIMAEVPTNDIGGMVAPFTNHAALSMLGGPPFRAIEAPYVRWFRVTLFASGRRRADGHHLSVQGIDGPWLERRGFIGPDGDLYKVLSAGASDTASDTASGNGLFSVYAQHTNLGGNASEPIHRLGSNLSASIAANIPSTMVEGDNILQFAAASTLASNWDGMFHNHWLYRRNDNFMFSQIPGYMGKSFGILRDIDAPAQMNNLPIQYPRDGLGLPADYVSRPTGLLTARVLQNPASLGAQYGGRNGWEQYLNLLSCGLSFSFGEGLQGRINVVEKVLAYDMGLLYTWACGSHNTSNMNDCTGRSWQADTGGTFTLASAPNSRLTQTRVAFAYVRNYITERRKHLLASPLLQNPPVCFSKYQYWSDGSYWHSRGLDGLPQAGDDVIIPGGEHVVLDIDTPVLNRLTIEGSLQFSRDKARLELHAKYIFVLGGGLLRAGSSTSPHTGEIAITLHGSNNDLSVQRWGSKVLAVMRGGKIQLHGKPRTPSWTHLVSSAPAGSSLVSVPDGDAFDWVATDDVVIASSSHDRAETEARTILSSAAAGFQVTPPVSYDHNGQAIAFAAVVPQDLEVDGRAIVACLTRNIVISGTDDASGWGCSIVIQGQANLRHVALRRCGNSNTGSFAMLIDGRGPGVASGYIRDCIFRDGYNSALATRGERGVSLNFQLSRNVVYKVRGTAYSLQVPTTTFSSNVALSIDTHGFGVGGVGFDAHIYTSLNKNRAIGAARYGFLLSAGPCSGNPDIANSAYANGVSGVHIVSDNPASSQCGRITGFTAIKNPGTGFSSEVVGSLTITNVYAIDNAIGFRLDALVAAGMPPTVLTIDASTIIARVGVDASDGPCQAGPLSPTTAFGIVPATLQSYRHLTEKPLGCAGGQDVCVCGTTARNVVPAVDNGYLSVRNVNFINFRGSNDACGPSFAFSHTDTADHTVLFTKMLGVRAVDVLQVIPVPWFLPGYGSASSTNDGRNHVVVEDSDGSFAGDAGSWLATKNVGFAMRCTIMSSNGALKCPSSQELRRVLIEPLRDANQCGRWHPIAIENAEENDPCNADSTTLWNGLLPRPGCDIIFKADGVGRFWSVIDAKARRRIRFKLQPFVAAVRISILRGIPPRDADLPPAILDVFLPDDPRFLYFVWAAGVRQMPQPDSHVFGAQDTSGSYVRGSGYLRIALAIGDAIEIRTERSLTLEWTFRDLDPPGPDLTAALGRSFGIQTANIDLQAAQTVDISAFSSQTTVFMRVFGELFAAAFTNDGALECVDRFTSADYTRSTAYTNVDPLNFGRTEQDWYYRDMLASATAFEQGCNDPNAVNYAPGAINHGAATCQYSSIRCRENAMPRTTRDLQVAAALKELLESLVAIVLRQNTTIRAPSQRIQISLSGIADLDLSNLVTRIRSASGGKGDQVRLLGAQLIVEGSWVSHAATALPGLSTTVSTCFEIASQSVRVNDLMFASVADADMYVSRRAAEITWLEGQPTACVAAMEQLLCGHFLQQGGFPTVCAETCERAFSLCPASSVPVDVQRCSGDSALKVADHWTSVIAGSCGYNLTFTCPWNHLAYPLCTYAVKGLVVTTSTYSHCNVSLELARPPGTAAIVQTNSLGEFDLAAPLTLETGDAYVHVRSNPLCQSTVFNGSLTMDLMASTHATVITPLSTLKAQLVMRQETHASANAKLEVALGVDVSGVDLEHYDPVYDLRKPRCAVSTCRSVLAVMAQLSNMLSLGQALIYNPYAIESANSANASNTTGATTGAPGGRRLQSGLIHSRSFTMARVLAARVQSFSQLGQVMNLSDAGFMLSLLQEARLAAVDDGDASTDDCAELNACPHSDVVAAVATVLSQVNQVALTEILGASAGAAAEAGGAASGTTVLERANALRSVVDSDAGVRNRTMAMQLASRDAGLQSEAARQEAIDSFTTEFTAATVGAQVQSTRANIGSLGMVDIPEPEPKPEPKPEPEPEPEPQAEPEPQPEPEPEIGGTTDKVEDIREGGALWLVVVMVLTALLLVSGAGWVMVLRKRLKAMSATSPYDASKTDGQAVQDNSSRQNAKWERPQRRKRRDKDGTIGKPLPKTAEQEAAEMRAKLQAQKQSERQQREEEEKRLRREQRKKQLRREKERRRQLAYGLRPEGVAWVPKKYEP